MVKCHVLATIFITISSGIVHSMAAVDITQCFFNIRNGPSPTGLDIRGQPVNDTSQMVAISYEVCKSKCGAGPEPLVWSEFSPKFTAYLLPWLALISQLPFGANDSVYNVWSVLLAVGSPVLAGYSVALTILNGRWVARRFSRISYPNANKAIRILNNLQQSPLQITNGVLLASLVVLPENDPWWSDLMDRLDYTHTWSISALTAIAWVVVAYIFTVIVSFTKVTDEPSADGVSDGQAVGSAWLWLLPIVTAWLQISPKCDRERLKDAILSANQNAYVATRNGPSLADTRAQAFTFCESDNSIYDHEECTAPIFNYARFLPWTREVDEVYSAFHYASCRADENQPVDLSLPWRRGDRRHRVHDDNRRGSVEQVETYCAPPQNGRHPRRSHWGPNTLSRFLVASFVALLLQWGTAGGAIVILWYTPTVGLGCRSGSYLIYAAVSTLVWMRLVLSSMLTHYHSPRHRHLPPDPDGTQTPGNPPEPIGPKKVFWVIVVIFRVFGYILAVCNAVWIILACLLQFGNFYNRCYCNSCAISLTHPYNVILTSASDVVTPWFGGLTLGCGSAILFVVFVNIFLHPDLQRRRSA